MNKIKHLIIVILFSIISLNAFADIDLHSIGLVTTDEFTLREVTELEEILTEIHREAPAKDLLFYIHGRGRDINDEYKMIKSLEKRYDIRVILFRWPSWSSLLTRPVRNAEESSREFAEVLYQLRDLKESQSHLFKNKKMSMFFHSMGNIVLESFMRERYGDSLNGLSGEKLFDNIALIGADVGLYNHRDWLNEIDFAHRKYVAMNNKDIVLQLSNLLDWKNGEPILYRLGLGFDKRHVKSKMDIPLYLDPDAVYIDLSRSLALDHRYFDSKKVKMVQIFGPMITGNEVDFSQISLEHKVEYGINYLID